jgi:hypothetical protein
VFDRSRHPEFDGKKIHHSSFGFKDDVGGAGNISFSEGKLTYIDNDSGHYTPLDTSLRDGVAELRGQGADVSGAHVNFTKYRFYTKNNWPYTNPLLPDWFPQTNLPR